MLRKFAVALLAASVFTAPVFAQGSGAPATPPAKTESKSGTAPVAAPKVVAANPDLKTAKVKSSKRYAHHRVKHVKHVAHVKRVKPVKSAHATHVTTKDHQVVTKSTTGQNGANGPMSAPKTKSNVN
jgi:hypothetical protein